MAHALKLQCNICAKETLHTWVPIAGSKEYYWRCLRCRAKERFDDGLADLIKLISKGRP